MIFSMDTAISCSVRSNRQQAHPRIGLLDVGLGTLQRGRRSNSVVCCRCQLMLELYRVRDQDSGSAKNPTNEKFRDKIYNFS